MTGTILKLIFHCIFVFQKKIPVLIENPETAFVKANYSNVMGHLLSLKTRQLKELVLQLLFSN